MQLCNSLILIELGFETYKRVNYNQFSGEFDNKIFLFPRLYGGFRFFLLDLKVI